MKLKIQLGNMVTVYENLKKKRPDSHSDPKPKRNTKITKNQIELYSKLQIVQNCLHNIICQKGISYSSSKVYKSFVEKQKILQ